jgi:hypothetical protein
MEEPSEHYNQEPESTSIGRLRRVALALLVVAALGIYAGAVIVALFG